MSRLVAVLATAALALGACGGQSDETMVRATVRAFFEAVRTGDSDRLCGDLATQEFLERTTGATGGRARDACRQQIRLLRRPNMRLNAIESTRVEGDRAVVDVTLRTPGGDQDRVVRLEREAEDWRVAGE